MMSGLESANLKLARAAEHIEAIRDVVWDYIEREPSDVTTEPNGKYVLNFREPPPAAIAVLAGEAIYQIRSALDHLAFELVKLNPNGTTLPTDWEEECVFPLWLDTPKKAPVYNCFKNTLPGITTGAFTFIESVQPYHRRDTGNILRMLAVLSNIDKHRHLNLTKPQAYRRDEAVVIHKGHRMHSSSVRRAEDGARIESPFPFDTQIVDMQVQGAFTPFVSFHESALGQGAATLPVDYVLELCLNSVKTPILSAFEQFLRSP